jgi:HSP20 family protein
MKLIRYREPETFWAPLDRLASLRDEFDRILEPTFGSSVRGAGSFNNWVPALDVHDEKDQVVVVAELPGLNKDEIEISLHNGLLSISGERKEETTAGEGETRRQERYFGRFSRSVTLPSLVDDTRVTASYKDGLLTVRLPKAEEAKPKQIQVNAE